MCEIFCTSSLAVSGFKESGKVEVWVRRAPPAPMSATSSSRRLRPGCRSDQVNRCSGRVGEDRDETPSASRALGARRDLNYLPKRKPVPLREILQPTSVGPLALAPLGVRVHAFQGAAVGEDDVVRLRRHPRPHSQKSRQGEICSRPLAVSLKQLSASIWARLKAGARPGSPAATQAGR